MGLLYAILLGAGGMIALASFLLCSWAIYYDLSRSNIPAGFDHPLKLRFAHWGLILKFILYFGKDTSLSHEFLKGSHVPNEMRLKYGKWMSPDNVPEKFKCRGYDDLPETLIVSCEYDIVRDDSLLYKKRLEDNGVEVRWFHAENGFHGVLKTFNLGFMAFPSSIEILDNVVDFVKRL